MRAVFVHDHRFFAGDDGVVSSGGGLPYAVFQRYLRHFDALDVVGRIARARPGDALTPAGGPGVRMRCLAGDGIGALVGGRAVGHVRAALAGADCAIIRLPSLLGVLACREAVRSGRPWMVEVVGCARGALWHHGSAAGKLGAPVLHAAQRHFVGKAPFALYISRYLEERYPSRGERVRCADVEVAPAPEAVLERRRARIAARAPGQPLRIGLAGSLDVDYKGHATALRALAALVRTVGPVRLSLLGGGSAARWAALARRLGVAESVEFAGRVPAGEAVLRWMDGLDVLVAPSRTEGLGRAVVEAMSRGLPVVGSCAGGIPELIGAASTHRPDDHRALARLVARLAVSPDLLLASSRRNVRAAEEYQAAVLDERRAAFLGAFAGHAAR